MKAPGSLSDKREEDSRLSHNLNSYLIPVQYCSAKLDKTGLFGGEPMRRSLGLFNRREY